MTELKMDVVEALSIELFGEYSLYSRARGGNEQINAAPALPID